MRRKNQKDTTPPSRSPSEEVADRAELARNIAQHGCRGRQPSYWEYACENLLFRLLSLGLDQALARVRVMRAAPLQYQQELEFLPLDDPFPLVAIVLSDAEIALTDHIERTRRPRPAYLLDRQHNLLNSGNNHAKKSH